MPSYTTQDLVFTLPTPYKRGHQCTSAEARVLNRELTNSLRNGLAKRKPKTQDDGESYIIIASRWFSEGYARTTAITSECERIARTMLEARANATGKRLSELDQAERTLAFLALCEEVRTEATRRIDEAEELAESVEGELFSPRIAVGAVTGRMTENEE